MNWIDQLAGLAGPCVIVTVAKAEGSTPREAGARMLVTSDAIYGTIGGGNLEFKATDRARKMLADASETAVASERYALGPSLGQCCGGVATLLFERSLPDHREWSKALAELRTADKEATLVSGIGVIASERVKLDAVDDLTWDGERLIEPIKPNAFNIAVFGAGHVGQAIVHILGIIDCKVTWIDEREAQFPASVPENAEVRWSDAPALEVDDFPPNTRYIVLTHSHALDQDICERVLRRGDFAYLGLIGSATKRATFERRLALRGIEPRQLRRMTCPIGIDGIESKEPGVVAVAVAAELMRV